MILKRRQTLKDIWIQFLAECIKPFIPDKNTYMKFYRRLKFIGKVRTLEQAEIRNVTKQAIAR